MRRALPLLAALLLAAAVALSASTAAAAVLVCFGKRATHVMQPGGASYHGTPGDDIVRAFVAGSHAEGGSEDVILARLLGLNLERAAAR